jgi:uncharacterized protein (DUF885 family)
VGSLKAFLKKFEAMPTKELNSGDAHDIEMVKNEIRGQLLELEQVKMWEKNPDVYSSSISEAIYVLMSRNFASQDERLKSVIEREKKSLQLFISARENLKNPPKVFTEVAIEQLPGIIRFFEKDVPLAFSEVKDEKLLAEFKKSNDAVIAGLRDYEKFLKTVLLAKSHGDFRLGEKLYRKKLKYEEMVTTSLDELLKIAMDDLKKNQAAYAEVGRRIDPAKAPEAILESMAKDHPEPDQLLSTIRKMTVDLRKFLIEKKIVTIPSEVMPIIQETPPFMRALTFASMDTPGPYEEKAKEAFYNVTLPEPNLPKKEIEEYMAGFNYAVCLSTSIHEAFPGHYVQFLWVPTAPSKVRKLIGANTNVEGWAHYTEQMVLDEGYGDHDPKMRLGQLQDALLRDARFVVGIKMHTGQMSFEDGVNFFVKEGYQSRSVAEKETKRGTSDPIYLYYTLGKLEILKLREDYKAAKGKDFSLAEFHDKFLSRGFPPIPIVREEILGKSTGKSKTEKHVSLQQRLGNPIGG